MTSSFALHSSKTPVRTTMSFQAMQEFWDREVERLLKEGDAWLEIVRQRREEGHRENSEKGIDRPKDDDSRHQSNLFWKVGGVILWGASAGATYFFLVEYHRQNIQNRSAAVALRNSWRRLYMSVERNFDDGCNALKKIPTSITKMWEEGVPLWFYLTPLYCNSLSSSILWTACGLAVLGWSEDTDDVKSTTTTAHDDITPKTRNSKSFEFGKPLQALPLSSSSSNSSLGGRHLEVMVHNVSHSDMILGLTGQDVDTEQVAFCRLRFSCVDKYSKLIRNASEISGLVDFPRHEREEKAPRFSIQPEPSGTLAAGITLEPRVDVDLNNVKVRRADQELVTESLREDVAIGQVLFPHVATLLPRWKEDLQKRGTYNSKRVLILISGVGTPRITSHDIGGNSTRDCAKLVQEFAYRVDPELTVILLHDESNVFRYDENLVFVKDHLLPLLDSYRDAHALGLPYPDELLAGQQVTKPAQEFDTDWRKSLCVSLSFADGTPARTYAIQSSLRRYRPTYYHFWQLKTFWHESKLVESDIEAHSFEEMDTSPAVDAEKIQDERQRLVIDGIKAFRDEMIVTLQGDNDLQRFWLRKTHKPVLAVLLIKHPETGRTKLYRGTNMEVSMPTGSLCAERNVIGSALSDHPGLRREHLLMIAVLSVPLGKSVVSTPENTKETTSLHEVQRVASHASLMSLGVDDPSLEGSRRPSVGSEQDEWVISPPTAQPEQSRAGELTNTTDHPKQSTPVRRVALFSRSTRKSKRTVVIQSAEDLNPLSPCGACNEWLKKIGESNPDFRVLTFTDVECHGVYCVPCND